MDLDRLIEFDRLAREEGQTYSLQRFLHGDIVAEQGRHFIGIAGPRGAGKTILLKQIALSRPGTFYLSVDTLDGEIFPTIKAVHEQLHANLFLLDEVHSRPGFEAELKKVYDFLDVRVIFTSSMALALYRSTHDLSRRVILKTLRPFTMREFVRFRHGRDVGTVTLEEIVEGRFDRSMLECGPFFSAYLQGGLLPFALHEASPLTLLRNIVETVIYKDIARVSNAGMGELDAVGRMLAFIGKSGIDGINYSSLSRNLGITKYKAEQYAALLERAFVLHRVMPEGTGVLKEPKIVMAPPYRLLYRPFEEAIGGLREDFFVEAASGAGLGVRYLKSTRGAKTPDYVVGEGRGVVFEIGGRTKGRHQFKGFAAERKIVLADGYETANHRRPLFLLGFLSPGR